MNVKTIAFDFGGILTGLDKQRCVEALRKVGAGRIAYYVDECKQEDLFHTLEMGLCSVHEFCEEARRQCSYTDENGVLHECQTTDEELVWAWNELLLGVPEEKLRIVKQLHDSGKYKLLVMSNTNVVHWERAEKEFFTHVGDKQGLTPADFFDQIFLSCDMHLVKPDPEIFKRMLVESDSDAATTLFIDDNKLNCEAAESVGITTIYDPDYDRWPELLRNELNAPTACTIGNFDGIHLGHQHVLGRLAELARERNLETLAVTFDRHPRTLFDNEYEPTEIMSLGDRVEALQQDYVDRCEVLKFDKSVAGMTAFEFMRDVLRNQYNVRLLLLGYNNRFGKRNPDETFDDYVRYGSELGIEVIACDEFTMPDGSHVSSTIIRELMDSNELTKAQVLLGKKL